MNMQTNQRSTLLALATALAFASVSAGCRDQDPVEDNFNGRVAPGAEGVADDPVARTPADATLMPGGDTGLNPTQSGTMQADATAQGRAWRVGEDQATFLRGALASGEAEVAISRHVQNSATSQEVRALAQRIAQDHEALNRKLRNAGAGAGRTDAASGGAASSNSGAGLDGMAQTDAMRGGSTGTGSTTAGSTAAGSTTAGSATAGSTTAGSATAGSTAAGATQTGAAQGAMERNADTHPMNASIRALSGEEMERAYLEHMREAHGDSIARYEAAAANGDLKADVRALAEQALPTLRAHRDAVQQTMDRNR